VTPGGGGLPIAAIAGVAGPVAMASLAKAVTKRTQGRATAAAAYWFYVEAATPVFSIEDHTRQVAELRPGSWYLARAEYDEWVHMKDDDSGAEGWVPGWAAKRQG
jgi:SH3-like domain-containing protein